MKSDPRPVVPGSEGTADLAVSGAGPLLTEVRGRQRPAPHPQAPWNNCPFTCIHPRRLACGILQPTATQDPPFIPANWWHPSYTVPTWLVPFTNWTTYMFFSILSLWKLEVQCPLGVTTGFVAGTCAGWCRASKMRRKKIRWECLGHVLPMAVVHSIFEVRLLDGICSMGSITRKWNDVLSAVSDADHFEIHFPLDLDAMMKAMVFGASFLIHLPGNGYQGETVPFSSLIDLQHSKRECVHIFFIFQEVTL
ncbi:uncharacterized protein LOC128053084 [Budorcas taxicolor]|uniref:uncharacterized protein LOC128053084 n=1 Tax=Budorcas taxicolor TaxID=37181 RepID=UPI002283C516|nr:uncharacterized protein LOC128053084 [Budorcas taxicolor]